MSQISKTSKNQSKKKGNSSSYKLKKQKEEETFKKIRNDEDFIVSKENDNSLHVFLKTNKKAKEYEIADFLQLSILEVNKIFKESLKKIKYFIQE